MHAYIKCLYLYQHVTCYVSHAHCVPVYGQRISDNRQLGETKELLNTHSMNMRKMRGGAGAAAMYYLWNDWI